MVDDGVTSTLTASAGATTSTPATAGHADTGPGPSPEEVVRSLFDAFSRRALTETLALLHPEVVFQPMTAEVTQAGEPYRGHEGIRRYAADVEAQWTKLTLRPTQIRAAGQAVVALGLVSGSGRAGVHAGRCRQSLR